MGIKIKKEQIRQKEKSTTNKSDLTSILQKEIYIFGKKWNTKKKQRFFESLSILTSAGLTLKQSLEIIREEKTKNTEKNKIEEIESYLISGLSFSSAIKETKLFDEYDYFSIEIGENTGNLQVVFRTLSLFYDKQAQQRRMLISSLTYPVIILSTAAISVWFMLRFIVPLFMDVFKRVGGELPTITRWVIEFSEITRKYGAIFFIIVGILIVSTRFFKKWEIYRNIQSKIIGSIPIIGSLVKKIQLARFAQSMQLMTASQIPLLQSLDMAKRMARFYPLEKSLERIKLKIIEGNSLHYSMSEESFFPKRMNSMVKVGEETHQLPFIFEQINEQYNKESQYTSSQLGTILEPFIILFLGAVVGFILISMYLPMFKLSTGIQ